VSTAFTVYLANEGARLTEVYSKCTRHYIMASSSFASRLLVHTSCAAFRAILTGAAKRYISPPPLLRSLSSYNTHTLVFYQKNPSLHGYVLSAFCGRSKTYILYLYGILYQPNSKTGKIGNMDVGL
jgi:hypothetical protein